MSTASSEPAVSVIMPCYQQETYVGEAVRAILAQDYRPLEIVISDDASTDNTMHVIKDILDKYQGPHRVVLCAQPRNQGTEHYNNLRKMAKGEILVIAHGDDISYPHRVRRMVDALQTSGASLATSNADVISASGKIAGALISADHSGKLPREFLTPRVYTTGLLAATMALRRELLDDFPPFRNLDMWLLVDHVLSFRAALMNGVYYLNECLLSYRDHKNTSTNSLYFAQKSDPEFMYFDLSRRIGSLSYRLTELGDWRRKHPGDGELAVIEKDILDLLHEYLAQWRHHRNMFLSQRKKEAWLTKEEQLELSKLRRG